MTLIADRSRRALVTLTALAAGILLSAGTAQAAPLSVGTLCSGQGFSTPFAPWGDLSQYALLPGGSFETRSPWTLSPGATVVSGNEPYYVSGNQADAHSLELASGSSATSAPMCVTLVYPWLRLFAQNTGSLTGSLQVDVQYVGKLDGLVHTLPIALLVGPSTWTLSPQIPLLLNTLAAVNPNGQAAIDFRFTPVGSGSSWKIDDVYVDPYRRS